MIKMIEGKWGELPNLGFSHCLSRFNMFFQGVQGVRTKEVGIQEQNGQRDVIVLMSLQERVG